MIALAVGFAVLAVALAVPVPNRLATARWPSRHPGAAIVLWQAIGLAGGCSILTALGLAAELGPLPVRIVAGGAGLALAGWLLAVLAFCSIRTVRDLSRQRQVVDLTSSPLPGQRDVRVLSHEQPTAYCLPGTRPRVVLSTGATTALHPEQLTAVIAHERAHARGRHELVIQPFVAWESTFPFLAAARRARLAVSVLVEMLADDVARRSVDPHTLADALVALGDDHLAHARARRLLG